MNREFDRFAKSYSDLLDDPMCNRFSRGSDYFHRRKWLLIEQFLHRRGLNSRELHWLDAGYGQGDLLRLGKDHVAKAASCDPSGEMISGCGASEGLQQATPTDLSFPGDSFDFVSAVCVHHHVALADRAALTRSIYRVLRPGGVLVLIEHNPWNPVTRMIVKRCPVHADAQLLTANAARNLTRGARPEEVRRKQDVGSQRAVK